MDEPVSNKVSDAEPSPTETGEAVEAEAAPASNQEPEAKPSPDQTGEAVEAEPASNQVPEAKPSPLPTGEAVAAAVPEEEGRRSRLPTILFLVALAIGGAVVALATMQETLSSGLILAPISSVPPGKLEKYGENNTWWFYPEVKSRSSCWLHGGSWESQSWTDSTGAAKSREFCRAD